MNPDESALRQHLGEAPFLIGAHEDRWGMPAQDRLPPDLSWPFVILWVSVSTLELPHRLYFRFDCENYPVDAVTGAPWDLESKNILAPTKRPKLKGRGELLLRTDWEGGRALYHPYDRVAANSHTNWRSEYPHLVWDRNHTIVDLLEELHVIVNE